MTRLTSFIMDNPIAAIQHALAAGQVIAPALVESARAVVGHAGPYSGSHPTSFDQLAVKSIEQRTADAPTPHLGSDEHHRYVAVSGLDRTGPVVLAARFGQCHGHHIGTDAAHDNTRVRRIELLPHASDPVRAWRKAASGIGGSPYFEGATKVVRRNLDNGQIQMLARGRLIFSLVSRAVHHRSIR